MKLQLFISLLQRDKKKFLAQQIFKLDESPSNYSNCKEKKKRDLQITSEFITFTTITSLSTKLKQRTRKKIDTFP